MRSRLPRARFLVATSVVVPRGCLGPVQAVHPGDSPHPVAVVLGAGAQLLDEAELDEPFHVAPDRADPAIEVLRQLPERTSHSSVPVRPGGHGVEVPAVGRGETAVVAQFVLNPSDVRVEMRVAVPGGLAWQPARRRSRRDVPQARRAPALGAHPPTRAASDTASLKLALASWRDRSSLTAGPARGRRLRVRVMSARLRVRGVDPAR